MHVQPTFSHHHIEMDEFLASRNESEFKSLCGLSFETFRYIYNKYCGITNLTTIINPGQLYDIFFYMKVYPVIRNLRSVLSKEDGSNWYIQDTIKRDLMSLALVIDELSAPFQQRHHPSNCLPHVFGANVTSCIESFPIVITRPDDADWQTLTCNGKYGANVLKAQLVCDNKGTPIWFSGPHVGTLHDMTLCEMYPPPVIEGEQIPTRLITRSI